ncbi:benzoate dioxygenase, ferredoxin reductase component [Raoultella ornithinolytica]|nr:benzoate dioxygenase, ferredoxin reductase component [Raoultella ornithinolytica]
MFTIALNFEDGITRFIQCNAGEKVLDAAYRQKVNLPMDARTASAGPANAIAPAATMAWGKSISRRH